MVHLIGASSSSISSLSLSSIGECTCMHIHTHNVVLVSPLSDTWLITNGCATTFDSIELDRMCPTPSYATADNACGGWLLYMPHGIQYASRGHYFVFIRGGGGGRICCQISSHLSSDFKCIFFTVVLQLKNRNRTKANAIQRVLKTESELEIWWRWYRVLLNESLYETQATLHEFF